MGVGGKDWVQWRAFGRIGVEEGRAWLGKDFGMSLENNGQKLQSFRAWRC